MLICCNSLLRMARWQHCTIIDISNSLHVLNGVQKHCGSFSVELEHQQLCFSSCSDADGSCASRDSKGRQAEGRPQFEIIAHFALTLMFMQCLLNCHLSCQAALTWRGLAPSPRFQERTIGAILPFPGSTGKKPKWQFNGTSVTGLCWPAASGKKHMITQERPYPVREYSVDHMLGAKKLATYIGWPMYLDDPKRCWTKYREKGSQEHILANTNLPCWESTS